MEGHAEARHPDPDAGGRQGEISGGRLRRGRVHVEGGLQTGRRMPHAQQHMADFLPGVRRRAEQADRLLHEMNECGRAKSEAAFLRLG